MNPLAQMMVSGTEGSAVGSIHNMVEMMKGIQWDLMNMLERDKSILEK